MSWVARSRERVIRRTTSGWETVSIAFLCEDEGVARDESGFLKVICLELKAEDVEELKHKIVAFGVKVLEVPDPHLYFQAQGDTSCGWSESSPRERGTAERTSGWRLIGARSRIEMTQLGNRTPPTGWQIAPVLDASSKQPEGTTGGGR
jgi:hypothetical protein